LYPLLARSYIITHEYVKHAIRLFGVPDAYLLKHPEFGIHGGVP
jgi:hypothetical protein